MQSTYFCSREKVDETFRGKSVAIVGSGPGVLANPPGLIDSHEVVVRINNYKLFPSTGLRTDVFYSFFGGSITKTQAQLKRDGVKLCVCKCPDAKFLHSEWHETRRKFRGTDFRYIYEQRASFWFCPTYVPTVPEFMRAFEILESHVPTTGFSAILEVLECEPAQVYLTGFDFFESGKHNVNESWRQMNPDDPIGHRPTLERKWMLANFDRHPITMDETLSKSIQPHAF